MNNGKIITLPFVTTVEPRSYKSLASRLFTTPISIIGASFSFPGRTLHNLKYYLFGSVDNHTPTDALPPGTNVLQEYTESPYIVGENGIITINTNFSTDEGNNYIKIAVRNDNFMQHTVAAFIDVQILDRR